MSQSAQDREPCPWRIVEDAGGAFVFGLVGGCIWHSVGGARNAPRGEVLRQMAYRVKTRVPIVAGSFAVWGVCFSSFDCTFAALRKREDPWNAILSGAATGGVLAIRAGMKAAAQNAVVGGVLLAAIEGLGLVIQRVLAPQLEAMQQPGGMRIIDSLEPPIDYKRPYYKKTRLENFDKPTQDSRALALQNEPGEVAQLEKKGWKLW